MRRPDSWVQSPNKHLILLLVLNRPSSILGEYTPRLSLRWLYGMHGQFGQRCSCRSDAQIQGCRKAIGNAGLHFNAGRFPSLPSDSVTRCCARGCSSVVLHPPGLRIRCGCDSGKARRVFMESINEFSICNGLLWSSSMMRRVEDSPFLQFQRQVFCLFFTAKERSATQLLIKPALIG